MIVHIMNLLSQWVNEVIQYLIFQVISFCQLKSDSHLTKITVLFAFNENLLKMMKNVFNFTLNALFIIKLLQYLSWVFGHVEKTAWLER